jgi:hypothetical protein
VKELLVLVSEGMATVNGKPITPEEVARRAREGQVFVVQDKGDAQARIMEEFLRVAKESDGKVIVKD